MNCLDRHVARNPSAVAIIWEKNEPGKQEKITYKYVCEAVCLVHNILCAIPSNVINFALQRDPWSDLSDSQCAKEHWSTKRRQGDDLHANDAPGSCCNACLCKDGSCPLVSWHTTSAAIIACTWPTFKWCFSHLLVLALTLHDTGGMGAS